MTDFPLPYVVVVTDGTVLRTIHPPALGEHRKAIEAALAGVLGLAAPAVAPMPPDAAPEPSVAVSRPSTASMLTQGEMARMQGYEGDQCDTCQQFKLKRAGHCLVCDSCGTTTGCS